MTNSRRRGSSSPPQPCSVWQNFFDAAQQQTENCLLDVFVSMNRRRQAFRKQFEYVIVLGQLLALCDFLTGNIQIAVLVQLRHIVGDDDGAERAGGVAAMLAGQATEIADDLYTIARFD